MFHHPALAGFRVPIYTFRFSENKTHSLFLQLYRLEGILKSFSSFLTMINWLGKSYQNPKRNVNKILFLSTGKRLMASRFKLHEILWNFKDLNCSCLLLWNYYTNFKKMSNKSCPLSVALQRWQQASGRKLHVTSNTIGKQNNEAGCRTNTSKVAAFVSGAEASKASCEVK